MKAKTPFTTMKLEGRVWAIRDPRGNLLSAHFLKPAATKACKAINAAAEEWFEKRAAGASCMLKARRSK